MNEKCPCETVRELKNSVLTHEKQLYSDNTSFAEIRKDLQYIKESLDKKTRFDMSNITAIIQAVCTLAITLIASKLTA